ncbi:MAG: hypothetical protein A3J65_02035 [Candidatus Buchananbacteria bacterium RIFCSPHIGHO2_02_FULL_45_11b]|uniref:Uncharacterized protein n=4 Tax=Candidatus Buchananiibacteriota TaxID=1817903 RepID=A0A1G1YHQ7_9BACT|nr:MAG: hypothetical protein A2663_00395 [Candidatus Buchananbacteria bacterium RIFCSPHIGHO2_01_FULL_46_12]OGY51893.1 MAG: hypothetical protein A3J65_02035 [Candidatus Buchananbacteria bacterium RIFCSPHIGHO2_02_FULL_45_11b]OGY54175.1 MAG: hypothetical protein A3B15_01055 [Candidatus Buchananbacteria bacterium RIFCSPLOWO2_01_FULL_45_31]OGY57964.1 MAG: hypothetical protein A3H67_01730 [Candidatus Buchananbacteria bacterium RIFCSPLOWO2_02_FULL_46_11b]
MFNLIKKVFIKPKLEKEAFDAYLNRLPAKIDVDWFRDGKFIIGRIDTGDKKFLTQGLSVQDFIKMVNDSIYTVYDIPEEYADVFLKNFPYNPPLEARQKLEDLKVKGSQINLIKEKKLQLA